MNLIDALCFSEVWASWLVVITSAQFVNWTTCQDYRIVLRAYWFVLTQHFLCHLSQNLHSHKMSYNYRSARKLWDLCHWYCKSCICQGLEGLPINLLTERPRWPQLVESIVMHLAVLYHDIIKNNSFHSPSTVAEWQWGLKHCLTVTLVVIITIRRWSNWILKPVAHDIRLIAIKWPSIIPNNSLYELITWWKQIWIHDLMDKTHPWSTDRLESPYPIPLEQQKRFHIRCK
jgi:hypothetical protein